MKGTTTPPRREFRSLRGLLCSLAFMALAATTGLAATSPTPITAIQVDDSGALVRLIAAGNPTPAISHLRSPNRTVVDFAPARLAIKGSGSVTLPVGNDIIDRVRVGQFRTDIVRVVIDHPGAWAIQVPTVQGDGEQIAISFDPTADLLGPGIPAPAKIVTQVTTPTPEPIKPASATIAPQLAQQAAISAMLADLPLDITGDADHGTILFKYPNTASYTIWLERFPNRLVFETPARPAGIAPTEIRYELTELAQVDLPLVNSIRLFEASAGGYTKVVCYLNSFVNWTDKLTAEGVAVAVTSATPPPTEREAAANVAFSGRDWAPADAAPATPSPAGDAAAMIEAQQQAEMAHDAGSAAEGIRIREITASTNMDGALDPMDEGVLEPYTPTPQTPATPVPPMTPDSGPTTLFTPTLPEVAPMRELSAPELYLFKGESVIMPVTRLVRTSIGDPEVLAVNVLSQSELLITAKGPGRTSLITWEEGLGRTIRTIDVSVSKSGMAQELVQVLNDQGLDVSFVGDATVVLEGKVNTEAERNRAELIAKGSAANVVNLIQITDPHQILIKVRMVELNNRDRDELYRQLGAGTKTESGDFSFSILSDVFNPAAPGGGLFDLSLKPGIVNNPNVGDVTYDPIDFFLKAMETSRKARVLSQPNIVTMSGHEAKFRVGGEVPFTYQNENGFNVVDFREFGIELNALPVADQDGNISVLLNPMVRTVDNSLAVAGIPGFRTRTVTTSVQLESGTTLVIGGLIQREISETRAKVPFLGDLPLIGSLFRSKDKLDDETELLIFLTLTIIQDSEDVQGQIYSEADVQAGGVDDSRYTFYSDGMQSHLEGTAGN